MGSLKAGVKWDLGVLGRHRDGDGFGVLVKSVEMDAIGSGGQALVLRLACLEANNGERERECWGFWGENFGRKLEMETPIY